MSIFKIPDGVAQEIEKIQRIFLWGDGTAKRKLHGVRWEEVCKCKRNGRLGIRRILDKNKGLIAKWIWRYGVEDKSLWKRLISGKYGVMYSLDWKWKEASNSSAFVKAVGSLFKEGSVTCGILNEDLKIVIGDGERASFWTDLCWDTNSLKMACPRIYALAV
ncbi:hypothetical protein Dsin_010194 [Dipteronia sinensis]|uniref:Uncharacterized protein n=1 Tax=Dipteronia sinensis TaxID=43782 RepID=A0AAE0ATC7_9ROSI|nr:hypothetical protein Dsin_010194 [Dipteronia sinensis]